MFEDEWRQSKQLYRGRPEYWEDSWSLEAISCHSNTSGKTSAKTDVKNLQRDNNNNNNNNKNNNNNNTMHKALHSWDDIDRLYVPWKDRGRGLASIEDRVDAPIKWLVDFIRMRTDYRYQKRHWLHDGQQWQKLGNENGKKNNFMGILND